MCRCELPQRSPNPRRVGICNACGYPLPEVTSPESFDAMYERLAEALFRHDATGELATDPAFDAFVAEAKARERAGRDRFGFSFLARDNKPDANEEWTDGANYTIFDSLQAVRATGSDSERDLVLSIMRWAYYAYRDTRELAAKRRGSTGPGMDS